MTGAKAIIAVPIVNTDYCLNCTNLHSASNSLNIVLKGFVNKNPP